MLAAERSFELFELSDTQIIPLQYISMTCGSAVLQVVLLLTYNSRVMATPLDADRPDFETMTAKDLTQGSKNGEYQKSTAQYSKVSSTDLFWGEGV